MNQREQGEMGPKGDPQPQSPIKIKYQERAQADCARLQQFLATKDEEERKKLTNPDEYIPAVIQIAGGLYPKTPETHTILLDYLCESGYGVEDLTIPNPEKDKYFGKPIPEEMRIHGRSTGFAKLREDAMQRAGKCGSCNEYISIRGVQSHNHQCEKCGAITYQEMIKGSQVAFSWFRAPKNPVAFKLTSEGEMITNPMDPQLFVGGGSLIVERYDDKSRLIYCYGELAEAEKEGIDFGERTKELYRKLADAGHTDHIMISRDDISDIWGHSWNHKIVKLYQGKEYGEWDRLPVAEMLNLYEPWHWAPAEASPDLHNQILSAAGQVSDKGYYYQDGRAAFWEPQLENMRRFVDHFTTLDLIKWDQMIRTASKSGPGMIDALAHFCHTRPNVIDKPNIGNALIGLVDSMQGKPKTKEQLEAEKKYLQTEGFNGTVDEAINNFREALTEEEVKRAKQKRNFVQKIWESLDLDK